MLAKPQLCQYNPIICCDPYATSAFWLQLHDVIPYPSFIFGSASAKSYVNKLTDGQWYVLAATYDGTKASFYINGVLMVQGASTVTNPVQFHQILLSNFNNSCCWPGKMGYVSVYSIGHSATQIANNYKILKNMMLGRGVTNIPDINNLVVFEGDSLTADNDSGVSSYVQPAVFAITPTIQARNLAVSGSGIPALVNRAAAVDAAVDLSRNKNIFSVLIGTNDLLNGIGQDIPTFTANFVAELKSYCLARKAAGWKVIAFTVPNRAITGFDDIRTAANTLIKADNSFYDTLVDIAADSTIGTAAAAYDTTYFFDGTHMTAAANAIVATYVDAAIEVLL